MSKPTVTAPIPDSNNNGILDGKDVLAQMKAEEVNGIVRDSSERAHGVFEALATRGYTQEINAITISRGVLRPDAFEQIAAHMNKKIQYQVATTNAKMAEDPDYRTHAEEHIRAMTKTLGKSQPGINIQASIDMNVADERNFNDFVQTFNATFPEGVKIEATDVKDILAHFGKLAFIPPDTPAPAPKEKPEKNR